jgi:agmatine deiminase
VEWPETLDAAQERVARLCRAIVGPGNEPVRLLVKDDAVEERARNRIGDVRGVEYVRADYDDCWLRDTAPVFGHRKDGGLGALRFRFNAWGGKYDLPLDARLAEWMVGQVPALDLVCPLTLEGGALETDGRGTFLTTESCTLNPNRNPGLTRGGFEEELRARVFVKRIVWLGEGLRHDHTDGHVDMVARFTPEGAVLCMRPNPEAPNARVLAALRARVRDAGLSVMELPAPRAVLAPDGTPMPASYCNFYVANEAVIVPTYDMAEDAEALAVVAEAFPGREVIGLPARDLLCGGGAFHCVTQPQPLTR